ncbi:MAG: ATP-dependent helicase UvrD/PcrA [Pseudothermotoga sp.]|uniref:ATP-dependent helicase n=1 Tax=Pseudothermotoga TaxID=1643951 RepID=UPI00074795D4|nr:MULTISPECIES: ATP-dependent helicase [Pseudothermotoga]KUK20015.1 MAG: UvrD/REP helicase [Pseudothermotoga lettingae]MDI3495472.1 ATP-dependent helicase UvrD/PcrA [Pseudothermotoga sp.]HBJ81666.1 ATP-dependent helicase [Pseudothermotoga sp.]HBT25690.1 ATP-dependent helicase [Pseudothermotoga sp.]
MEDYLQQLDDEQRTAVLKSAGRSIIIAGPGSGKTRVITYKLLHLLKTGIKPSEILLVTFTRAAANEMIDRARMLTGIDLEGITAGTFHHICNLILRRYARKVGLFPNFTILDEEDSKSLIKHVRTMVLERTGEIKHFPSHGVLQKIFSYATNTMSTLHSALLKINPKYIDYEKIIEDIYREYTIEKRNQNCVDYDDLLVFAVQVLQDSDIRLRESRKYKWILVDEFQDTNILQLNLIELLSSFHKNIVVVADDSQSIYSFRGARYENVRDFMKIDGTKLFKIQTNYRSVEPIVKLINATIPKRSVPKVLRAVKFSDQKPIVIKTSDRQEEAAYVSKQILRLIEQGFDPEEIAVLYRSHSHSLELQIELSKQQIDFKILSGIRFTETAHVKDIIAFLRILQNPREKISWIRVARLFPGIGAKTASNLAEHAYGAALQNDVSSILDGFSQKKGQILEIKKLLSEMQEESTVSDKISFLYESFYQQYLQDNYPDYKERQQDIERLIEVALRYNSLEHFLSDLTVNEDVQNNVSKGQKITLTTVHQAKGLEWDVVFVISVNPGDFPSYYALMENNIDEEERIFYVAITRPRKLLYLVTQQYPSSPYMYWAKAVDFLQKIPEELVDIYDTSY